MLYSDYMKTLILFLLSISTANAECYTDWLGQVTCIPVIQTFDLRDSTNSPKIIEGQTYRGNLNNNILDPNSINNTLGKYGNPLSPDSIKNPFRNK
jgi:hypothetical protein